MHRANKSVNDDQIIINTNERPDEHFFACRRCLMLLFLTLPNILLLSSDRNEMKFVRRYWRNERNFSFLIAFR